jgi:hypothetical protein
MLAMFVALGAVFKISLAVIPNVELLTFWVFVVTIVYGLKLGIIVGVLANFTAEAIIVHLYKKAGFRSKRDYLYCGILVTVAFDLFTVITTTCLIMGVPLLAALYMQYGIMPPTFYPFGIVHTVSNAILFFVLGVKITEVLKSSFAIF